MARQNTTKARGDATTKPTPIRTPAPVKTYVQPGPGERDMTPGYGNARNFGASSIEPGTKNTSPLADELKRVNALGDGGDHLQNIIEHGTARNSSVDLAAPQTRSISDKGYPVAHGMKSPSAPATIPDKLGAPVNAGPVRKPS